MARSFKDFPPVAQVASLAAVAVIVVGALAYLYVFPLFEQKATLQKQVDDLHAENQTNRAFEQKTTEYKILIAQLETQLATLRSMVPDVQATDEFMKTIFKDSTEASIHVRSFVANSLVTKDYYIEMPFALHLDGTYWGLVNYFNRLAHEQRIISVTSIELGPPATGGLGTFEVSPSETVGANCIVTAYINRSPESPPAGATPKK